MKGDNKRVATELHAELRDVMKLIADQIDGAGDDGPLMPMICESLRKAISALKTTVR